ncbi:MAG: signal recognition particle protein [Candidatus Neomarinimicrobiota bacterium]|nr:signal recognition particle protein [Candidatus Neomarinimicrobiota bacterium]|tara:strand:+ start:1003 stop:2328 length:1326 start_codon:yes stop_codon:yes gene_type:complete
MFDQISDRFNSLLRNLRGLGKITDKNIEDTSREIRRILLEADVNITVTKNFVQKVKDRSIGTKVVKSIKPGEQFIKIIHDELVSLFGDQNSELDISNQNCNVLLLAGLQGSGKTTTCAKLAKKILDQGKSVLLVAADVYRPGAIKQLKILAERINVPVFESNASDPVKICFDALEEAKANKIDCIILDTAGRLHIDGEMMLEIQQISESVKPSETLFIADGMTGQDAVNSAKAFNEALEITGIILTKMDGDARGGAAVSIASVINKPVKFIGISEKINGIDVFDPKRMADRILGLGDVVGLVEKAEKIVNESEAKIMQEKILKNQFNLEDFKNQLFQIQKMGNINEVANMIPGFSGKIKNKINMDDRQILWTEAIINSMTEKERKNPKIINGSRRSRIASGSGRSVQEVNQLLKQFTEMQKMMKKFGKMKTSKLGFGSFFG